MHVDEALRTRISIRAFLDRPVERATVEELLEVARWSPSGGNIQPWKVIVVAGEAKQAFHNALFGRTPEQRVAFRQRILEVKLDDLLRVGSTYLIPEKASVAIITGTDQVSKLKDQDRYQVSRL